MCAQELYVEVTVLARDYNAGALPFPDALLRLPRLRALTLQIPCKVSLNEAWELLTPVLRLVPKLCQQAASCRVVVTASLHFKVT